MCSSILDEILATVGAIDLFMVSLRGEWIWYILIVGFIDEAIELIAYIVSLHMLYVYILRNACIYILYTNMCGMRAASYCYCKMSDL